jgi:hypothetical protein
MRPPQQSRKRRWARSMRRPQVGEVNRRRQEHRRGAAVEAGEYLDEPLDLARLQPPIFDQTVEHKPLVEPLHAHQPVDRPALAAQRQAAVPRYQRHHVEIDVRRQPAVEPQLGAAGALAPADGGKVEIGKAHRLLELVDALTGKEHPGHMGLAPEDLVRNRSIALWPAQKRQLGVEPRPGAFLRNPG